MKYIVGALFSVLVFGLIACGNEGDGSSVYTRKKIHYAEGFNMYKGSTDGAAFIKFDTVPSWDKDSLFRYLTLYKYLTKFNGQIETENKIAFEFLDGSRLSYTDLSQNFKIISHYIYRDDSLFVFKNGDEEVFVAIKEKEGNSYYRTKSVMRKMLWGANPKARIDTTVNVPEGLIDMELALEFAEIASKESMTSPRDSIVWNNIRYVYEQ